MSDIPSSEVELDDYCHTLYQEKVSVCKCLASLLCTDL